MTILRSPLSAERINAALAQGARTAEYDRLVNEDHGIEAERIDDLDYEIAGAVFMTNQKDVSDLRRFCDAYQNIDADTLPAEERNILDGVKQLLS